jgi:hypothetical protein
MTGKFTEEIAPNIEELKKLTNTKTDANARKTAVEELGKWKCRQSIDILWRLMINDLVFEVQHASFLKLQAFGEVVKLPKKAKGNLIKQIDKKIQKILNSIDGQISFEDFVNEFQKRMPEEFDVYKHDKKGKFESWLKNIISAFPKEIKAKVE